MPFKLSITKEDEPKWRQEYTYDKDTIVIGRDINSDLQLEGTKSVVSRRHTQIKRQGDLYQIEDLNSRNYTFLNDEKLKAGVGHKLANDDIIRICDFQLRFSLVEQETAKDADKTLLDYPNPFLQDTVHLSTLLKQICSKYDQEDSERKDEALQEAFQGLFSNLQMHKALEILAQSLQPGLPVAIPPTEELGDRIEISASEEPGDRMEISASQELSLMEMLLDFFVKTVQARRQFRMEFIGETMIRSAKTFSIYNCTPEELKKFLFDSDLPPVESRKRMAQLKNMVDELMLHQISLLDGYKSSVSSGSKQIIQRFNPEDVKKQLADKKSSLAGLKFSLPLFSALKLVEQYAGIHRELAQEDQSIIEKKYYRPSYVKRYNHCMDSRDRDDTDTPGPEDDASND
jgi:predicted component of type VI protein secretion system